MARKDILKEMREVLTLRHDALRQALAGDDSLLKDLELNKGGDVVDFAMDSASGEISSQLAEVQSRELGNIVTALARMEEGSYGKCEACNGKIPIARLQALPYATCCIECKRKAEEAGVEPANVVDWSKILDSSGADDLTINDFNIS